MTSVVLEQQQSLDVPFQVPFVQRLRFTEDVSGAEFNTLLSVLVGEHGKKPKVLVVVDGDVYDHSRQVRRIGQRLAESEALDIIGDNSGIACRLVGGEAVKNTAGPVKRILELVNQYDLDRRSYIIVIGGGAVLDAVGFAAAIAHRGIRLVRLPTTTLGQAD